MTKLISLTAIFGIIASTAIAGGPTSVESETAVMPITLEDNNSGSLGGILPLLVGAAIVAAVVIAAEGDDEATSGT